MQEGFDVYCLTKLFKKCSNLDTVTLAFEPRMSLLAHPSRVFAQSMLRSPLGDRDHLDQGVSQAASIAQALHDSGKR